MNPTKTITEALDALSAQIRSMQQRQPNVHYSLGEIWAKDKAARDALKAAQDPSLDQIDALRSRIAQLEAMLKFADARINSMVEKAEGALEWHGEQAEKIRARTQQPKEPAA